MVEARRPVDMFDRPGAPGGRARPSEGVLVYEVQRHDRVFYRATAAPGARYVNDAERWWMDVNGAIPGGYAVSIRSNPDPFVSGRLLFYRDERRDGTGDVRDPWVVGLGGWQQFRFLFPGSDGIVYAVPQ
jgi:hypothetical protein